MFAYSAKRSPAPLAALKWVKRSRQGSNNRIKGGPYNDRTHYGWRKVQEKINID
jgi:hypothetical protein